jgi:hypothetical protein
MRRRHHAVSGAVRHRESCRTSVAFSIRWVGAFDTAATAQGQVSLPFRNFNPEGYIRNRLRLRADDIKAMLLSVASAD